MFYKNFLNYLLLLLLKNWILSFSSSSHCLSIYSIYFYASLRIVISDAVYVLVNLTIIPISYLWFQTYSISLKMNEFIVFLFLIICAIWKVYHFFFQCMKLKILTECYCSHFYCYATRKPRYTGIMVFSITLFSSNVILGNFYLVVKSEP